MTTQPKELMTLEEAVDALRKLTTPLQHQISALEGFLPDRLTPKGEANLIDASDQLRSITSALHHLEAGRKGCECESFQNAQAPCTNHEMFGEAVRTWDGGFIIGPELPPISFCPWCGGKPPTAQEVNG